MNINTPKTLRFALTSLMISAVATSFCFNSTVQADTLTDTLDKSPQASQASPQVLIDAKSVLMAKLAVLNHFSANFSQKVLSESGEMLEQSSGKLAIRKPNLANWHTLEPDELAIVSDGQDVWFYNPWIEQVSVYALSAAIAKTPILLLTSKDESLWQEYEVTKLANTKNDSFVISAIDLNSQIKSLTLVFDHENDGQLTQFSFLDATGQLSNISLSDFDAKHQPNPSLFDFVIPDGVQMDDQRTN